MKRRVCPRCLEPLSTPVPEASVVLLEDASAEATVVEVRAHDVPGLLHLKVLRSPHAHARVLAVHTEAALAVPGVELVLTHADAPDRLFSTAQHENASEDPADTRVLDDVVRFAGQRVAAVVATSEAAAAWRDPWCCSCTESGYRCPWRWRASP